MTYLESHHLSRSYIYSPVAPSSFCPHVYIILCDHPMILKSFILKKSVILINVQHKVAFIAPVPYLPLQKVYDVAISQHSMETEQQERINASHFSDT